MAKQYSLDLTDFKTAAELNAQRLRLARIANRRLRALESAGRDYWAYDRATNYTQRSRGTNRYSQKKEWNGSIEGLKQELEELIAFLNSKTGDVSTEEKDGYKRGCGCRLSAKVRDLDSVCPAGKW